MSDNRDYQKPKTPALGVPREKWDDDRTHPGMPLDERLDRRTKATLRTVSDIPDRVTKVEDGLKAVQLKQAQHDGKLDILVGHSNASADERQRRRKHDAQQAERDRRYRLAAKIIGAIAAIVGAYLGLR